MLPGVPALLLLAGSVAVGLLGGLAARSSAADTAQQHAVMHACTTFCVAVVFWVWAIKNCVKNGFDLGAVTFLLAIGGAVVEYMASSGARKALVDRAVWMVPTFCGLVSANYLIGVFLPKQPLLLVVYFACGVVFWAAAAVLGFCACRGVRSKQQLLPEE
mmetsp:Transcript_59334/g.129972  ORF Transcript_59334/g.129972 Transcript_59334/m.129972 type:complete len:160 (-) Transcript_59334:83-562(-)